MKAIQYYNVKSIFSSNKNPIEIKSQSTSFYIADQLNRPYIEPNFKKIVFDDEKPTLLLVSAIGATGKTTLAEKLSADTSLPILDLSKHQPVAANTLTGILTESFDLSNIGDVLKGLAVGRFGVIIDGIDEGRSKTTEKGFEAFLDDIAKLCNGATCTTFILLGRTQILDDCWFYLTEKGISTALITILPFTTEGAKQYIDSFTQMQHSQYAEQYCEARNKIMEKLTKQFIGDLKAQEEEFMSFIGYPPVLDAIVTLLTQEHNYHKLISRILNDESENFEISLLYGIADYILKREREEKVLPNIVVPLIEAAGGPQNTDNIETKFDNEEQAIRLIAHCLGRKVSIKVFNDPNLDEKYEEHLSTFICEHPFITGNNFRNAVFEAMVLATLISSNNSEWLDLVNEYLFSHKHSYHLIYMMQFLLKDRQIPIKSLYALLGAAMEFKSLDSSVELRVVGMACDIEVVDEANADIEIQIEIIRDSDKSIINEFNFSSTISLDSTLYLGSRISGAFIDVPCNIRIASDAEIELTAPLEINARCIDIFANSLSIKKIKSATPNEGVLFTCDRLNAQLKNIISNGIPLTFLVRERDGIYFPAIQYVMTLPSLPSDPMIREKYFRLRRILMEFRSHSRGTLAKFKPKIEHERVLKGEIGRKVLSSLIKNKILRPLDKHYILDIDEISNHMGISWQSLRKGEMPQKLIEYLKGIE